MRAEFNHSRRIHKMRDVLRIVRDLGGDVEMTGQTELTLRHWSMPHSVTTNATRVESSDKVTTWIRQLIQARAVLREAFGFPLEDR